jgi:hypothetical protein
MTSDAPIAAQLSRELLRDARADYRMCVASGLIDSSSDDWPAFLTGYADQAAFYTARGAAIVGPPWLDATFPE